MAIKRDRHSHQEPSTINQSDIGFAAATTENDSKTNKILVCVEIAHRVQQTAAAGLCCPT
jgi:hypothetical protein